jgi:hypothetical protein
VIGPEAFDLAGATLVGAPVGEAGEAGAVDGGGVGGAEEADEEDLPRASGASGPVGSSRVAEVQVTARMMPAAAPNAILDGIRIPSLLDRIVIW